MVSMCMVLPQDVPPGLRLAARGRLDWVFTYTASAGWILPVSGPCV